MTFLRTTSLQKCRSMRRRFQERCEELLLGALIIALLYRGGAVSALPWLLAAAVALVTLAFLPGKRNARMTMRPLRMLQWEVLLLAGLVSLSFFQSSVRTTGLSAAALTVGLALLFLWAMGAQQTATEEQTFDRRMLAWLAYAAVAFSFLLVLQLVLGAAAPWQLLALAPSPSARAALLLLLWPIVLRMRSSSPAHLAWEIATGFLIGVLLATGSLAAIAGLIAQMLLLAFWEREKRQKDTFFRVGAIALACALPLLFLRQESFSPFSSTIAAYGEWWKIALRLIVERPFMGWGPGSFAYLYPQLQETLVPFSAHPHSFILRLGVESGLLAVFCISLITGNIISSLRQRSGGMSALCRMATLAAAGGVWMLLVDEDPSAIAVPFLVVLFAGFAARLPVPPSHAKRHERRLPGGFLAATAALLLLLIAARETRFLFLRSFAQQALGAGRQEQAAYWYELSQGSWQTENGPVWEAATAFSAGDAKATEQKLRTYLRENPYDAQGWRLLGDLLSVSDPAQAREWYARAYRLNGGNALALDRAYLEALLSALSRTQVKEERARLMASLTLLLPRLRENMEEWNRATSPPFPEEQVQKNRREGEEIRRDLLVLPPSVSTGEEPPPSPVPQYRNATGSSSTAVPLHLPVLTASGSLVF